MRVLKVLNARSVWLFPIDDLNPRGKAIGSNLIDWLKEVYQFEKYPASAFGDEAEFKGLTFEGGKFKPDRDEYIYVNLTIYRDGLLASTQSSTEDSDKFLTEALGGAIKEFGLTAPGTTRRKLYFNEMDVQVDKPLTLLNPKLQIIADRITELRQWDQTSPKFEFSGVSFFPPPLAQPSVAGFAIERKIGVEWTENRFYTKAPLQTPDHILLLNELEHLLS